MYKCKHCGLEYMTDEAVMCPRCQAPKGKGTNYCPFCGTRIEIGAPQDICMNCGVDMNRYGIKGGGKSKIAAGLLGIFLGNYGVHNFYLGYIKKAIVQLGMVIMGWICYIGSMVSFIASESLYYDDSAIVAGVLGIILFAMLLLGVRIWTFIEGILILCGKINKDGKGRPLN